MQKAGLHTTHHCAEKLDEFTPIVGQSAQAGCGGAEYREGERIIVKPLDAECLIIEIE